MHKPSLPEKRKPKTRKRIILPRSQRQKSNLTEIATTLRLIPPPECATLPPGKPMTRRAILSSSSARCLCVHPFLVAVLAVTAAAQTDLGDLNGLGSMQD